LELRIPLALLSTVLLLLSVQFLSQILLSPPTGVAAQLLKGTLPAAVTVHLHEPWDGRAGEVGGEDKGFGSGSVAADIAWGGWKP
jgi:hypothetical protein